MAQKEKKIVIVADWLTNMGGMEQVVAAMAGLYPRAPIYTSLYIPEKVPMLLGRDVRTSWLQRLPYKLRQAHQKLLPFFPMAMRHLDLSEFDIIISSSSAFSKCVRKTRRDQVHICYCHTPVRYLYHARAQYLKTYPLPNILKPLKPVLPKILDYLTNQDQLAAKQVDHFIGNSDYVRQRIKKYYQRDSLLLHPCVDTKPFEAQNKQGNYYFALGRFVPYKKFDLLVQAFVKNKLPLKLAGIGVELEKCKAIAQANNASNIEFLGYVEDQELRELYRGAKAFLFPADEDFGLTPIEAMACGVPIIAYRKGGVMESVTNKTGVFFEHQTVESIQQAIELIETRKVNFDAKQIKRHAAGFDVKVFQKKLKNIVNELASS